MCGKNYVLKIGRFSKAQLVQLPRVCVTINSTKKKLVEIIVFFEAERSDFEPQQLPSGKVTFRWKNPHVQYGNRPSNDQFSNKSCWFTKVLVCDFPCFGSFFCCCDSNHSNWILKNSPTPSCQGRSQRKLGDPEWFHPFFFGAFPYFSRPSFGWITFTHGPWRIRIPT